MSKQYRVQHVPMFPGPTFTVGRCVSLQEAAHVSEALADYDLFLLAQGIRKDFSNMNWIEKLDTLSGEWDEIPDDDLEELLEEEQHSREQVLGVTAGAVSACWTNLEDAGIFKSDRARDLVDDAIATLFPKREARDDA